MKSRRKIQIKCIKVKCIYCSWEPKKMLDEKELPWKCPKCKRAIKATVRL